MIPIVSVICTAYNHEKYIKKALDGFVMQRANFNFEVIVHDDASTDKTADIIREYEQKYPDIIKGIYQAENKYSQNINIIDTYILPLAKGKYIALCEGDDYWIDEYKLQKQYDAMERYPELDVCAHGALIHKNGRNFGVICPSSEVTIFTPEQVIEGGGGFVATASLFFRKELYGSSKPKFIEMLEFDYTRQIHGSLRGGMLFLPDIMAVYNYGTAESWTKRVAAQEEKYICFCDRLIDCLQQLNIDTNGRYQKEINGQILMSGFDIDLRRGNFRKLLSAYYRSAFNKRGIKRRLYIYIMALMFGNRHIYEDKV